MAKANGKEAEQVKKLRVARDKARQSVKDWSRAERYTQGKLKKSRAAQSAWAKLRTKHQKLADRKKIR